MTARRQPKDDAERGGARSSRDYVAVLDGAPCEHCGGPLGIPSFLVVKKVSPAGARRWAFCVVCRREAAPAPEERFHGNLVEQARNADGTDAERPREEPKRSVQLKLF